MPFSRVAIVLDFQIVLGAPAHGWEAEGHIFVGGVEINRVAIQRGRFDVDAHRIEGKARHLFAQSGEGVDYGAHYFAGFGLEGHFEL